jgi:hypothetical protein
VAALPTPIAVAALTALIQPLLQPDDAVVWQAVAQSAPLEAHDGLTMAFLRLVGRWRPQTVILALTDRHLYWLELDSRGQPSQRRRYRLPLKGRLVLQGKGVIEVQLPGEPRRFLTFADRVMAGELCRRIDDRQQARQRAHAHVPEVVGVGVKPAVAKSLSAPGPHGETTVPQHEMADEIRPSFRPGRP